jgi:tellurite resistance protein
MSVVDNSRVRAAGIGSRRGAHEGSDGGEIRAIAPQEALIHMMVMVSAADREMHDVELKHMGRLIRELPAFHGFDENRLVAVAQAASRLMAPLDGMKRTMRLLDVSIPKRLRETAYVLACEIAFADRKLPMDEIKTLHLLRQALGIDRLLATAIERSTAARFAGI